MIIKEVAMNAQETRSDLYDAIIKGEIARAERLLDDYARLAGNYRLAMKEIMEPVLRAIGDNWHLERISLAQGYVAGKVAEGILKKIFAEEKGHTPSSTKGPLILGNIEDDFHALGRKLVSIFSEAAGWKVYDLGNDVTAGAFVDKAVETGARVLGVSAMMFTTAENIKKVRSEIDRRKMTGRIQLAVGGAVFNLRSELVTEVGGDGTASNCMEAPQLFDELWRKSLEVAP